MNKKHKQLGMPHGTASGRLRKSIIFHFAQLLDRTTCFHCGEQISHVKDLSIEHIKPWLDSDEPVANFFDLDNIAFAHLSCNSRAAKREKGSRVPHGTRTRYDYGCRCDACREAKVATIADYRKRRKAATGRDR